MPSVDPCSLHAIAGGDFKYWTKGLASYLRNQAFRRTTGEFPRGLPGRAVSQIYHVQDNMLLAFLGSEVPHTATSVKYMKDSTAGKYHRKQLGVWRAAQPGGIWQVSCSRLMFGWCPACAVITPSAAVAVVAAAHAHVHNILTHKPRTNPEQKGEGGRSSSSQTHGSGK